MQRWHWTALGIVVWLTLGGFGLRWMAQPYRWTLVADTCGCKDLERLRQDFPTHLASFPSAMAVSGDEAEGLDPALANWAWRESAARFAIVFTLWMIAGWFLQWCLSRLARGEAAR